MAEEDVKCPICGTLNKQGSETCTMCKTRLAKGEKGKMKVTSPKARPKTHIEIDIEDPLTRKKLEELTLIPGVTRKKALMLYQSGIHSMEEFLMKAFEGERFSTNYSRTVANKLLVQSLGKKKKGTEMPCPSCKAMNPASAKKCKVCNFDIESALNSVNIEEITDTLNDSVKDILENLKQSEDFEALPEEMKAQFAAAIGSEDINYELEKPKDIESLGIDLDKIDSELKETAQTPVPESQPVEEKEPVNGPEQESGLEQQSIQKAENKSSTGNEKADAKTDKKDKIRNILMEKVVKWRKAGYDVAPLENYLEDVEGFKIKAKEVLGDGKTVKLRYLKQLEMWREKGFDVSELEPILDTDIDLFQEKAKEILKKQKK